MTIAKPIDVLLVEDSATDQQIITEALNHSNEETVVHAVGDGVEALDYLRRQGKYADARQPHVILLDLNLPRMDGRNFLRELRQDPRFALTPVVVLTSSDREEDIADAYQQRANCYVQKPLEYEKLVALLGDLKRFWKTVTFPPVVPAQAPLESSRVNRKERNGGRILLIEDSPTDFLLIQEALFDRAEEFDVIHATRLDDALTYLQGEMFDLILTDLGLPDCQGLETFQHVARAAPTTPIVVLTGLDDEEAGMEAIKAGAEDYLLKKEIGGPGLRRVVRYTLERSRLERELLQSRKREAIGRLAGGIAHDFNNALTVISGHASLLQASLNTGSLSPDVAGHSIKEIIMAADRSADLTRRLLTYSRQQPVRLKALDFNALVQQSTQMLRVLGDDIELLLVLGEKLPSVLGDDSMLEQVIVNLVMNARDAMPDGGRLEIATGEYALKDGLRKDGRLILPGNYVHLRVSDEGCGIPEALLPSIFDPFFTTKDVNEGTGLGLATVWGIVEQHNGWVTVQSKVGHGTSFEVFLPASQSSASHVDQGNSTMDRAPGGTETIMLVEDDPAVRMLVTIALERKGYTVLSAENGPAACEVWEKRESEISLLMTDLVMPSGMSGIALANLLKTERPDLPIIFTSGYSQELTNVNIEERPNQKFLQKPVPLATLAAEVRKSLDEVVGRRFGCVEQ